MVLKKENENVTKLTATPAKVNAPEKRKGRLRKEIFAPCQKNGVIKMHKNGRGIDKREAIPPKEDAPKKPQKD